MDRNQAFTIVEQYIKAPNLIHHMLSVEAAMRFYARKLDQDEDLWGITGLLHDFDWEIHPTAEQHPIMGEPILRELNTPNPIIKAILAHGSNPAFPRTTLLDKGLFACDEITGLITAVALVRPSKSLYDLNVKSVKKKWKNKSFAAGADREEIAKGSQDFGVELWEHVNNVILAMRSVAPQIGLAGNIAP